MVLNVLVLHVIVVVMRVDSVITSSNVNEEATAFATSHIVVATPGRLLQLLSFADVLASVLAVRLLVLDEADEVIHVVYLMTIQLADATFRRDLVTILSTLPPRRQLLCFSATYPIQLKSLLLDLGRDPKFVSIDPNSVPIENLRVFMLHGSTQAYRSVAVDHEHALYLNTGNGYMNWHDNTWHMTDKKTTADLLCDAHVPLMTSSSSYPANHVIGLLSVLPFVQCIIMWNCDEAQHNRLAAAIAPLCEAGVLSGKAKPAERDRIIHKVCSCCIVMSSR